MSDSSLTLLSCLATREEEEEKSQTKTVREIEVLLQIFPHINFVLFALHNFPLFSDSEEPQSEEQISSKRLQRKRRGGGGGDFEEEGEEASAEEGGGYSFRTNSTRNCSLI